MIPFTCDSTQCYMLIQQPSGHLLTALKTKNCLQGVINGQQGVERGYWVLKTTSTILVFSEGYYRYLALCLTSSVRQLVNQCVSVFQNSYQGNSRLCRERKFCLEEVCTSQHTSNHLRSLAEQCHTQNFYLRRFKSNLRR